MHDPDTNPLTIKILINVIHIPPPTPSSDAPDRRFLFLLIKIK